MSNDLITYNDSILRVLDIQGAKALIIDCVKKSVPKWVDIDSLSCYAPCSDDVFPLSLNMDSIEPTSRKTAYERFTIVSRILPFITDKYKRCCVIDEIAAEKGLCKQTITNYLWLYLSTNNIAALAPQVRESTGELTKDQKNMRWALNKFYYTQRKNTLTTAYTLMLKAKYCDESGVLMEHYPTFNQFRYFYRTHKKLQTYYISRGGIKNYERNHRPLLGEGVQQFANSVGTAMLDSTVLDIYLVNDSGGVVGRPILTAAIDAYSGLCCGYSLSWEGGTYSLRSLMLNVIADKVELCKRHGIEIDRSEWGCDMLPATLVTDKGSEYISSTFEQLSDLGITIVNLPSYRPDLKSSVEKFFDVIQNLYKPHLYGKGVIMPDYQERGSIDYRKTAALTLEQFEKIILHCIVFYNSKRVLENYPYTEDMIEKSVQPYCNCVWNYGIEQKGANLISVTAESLVLTLLPRTKAKFIRKGLVVNGLRYRSKNENYTERYLQGGVVTAAYNPEDVSKVWLLEGGIYSVFALIDSRFQGKTINGVTDILTRENALKTANKRTVLQAKIDLVEHISVITTEASIGQETADIRGIRGNRKREQQRTHIDFVKRGEADE